METNFRKILKIIILAMHAMLMACSSSRDLTYFSDLKGEKENKTRITNSTPIKIQQGDLLSITIANLSPESSILFNSGIIPAASGINNNDASTVNSVISNTKRQESGYIVDQDGNVDFPVLGKIQLLNLTREEAIRTMTVAAKKYVKQPVIDIRLLNFKITVLGEVSKPSSFTIPQENINVIEALGMAGDMTEFGKRESVLIIREKGGQRVTIRLNLHKKEVFNSPYFYLQQNDIVYVEPDNKAKLAQTSPNNRYIGILAAVISTLGYALIALTVR